MPPLRSRGLAAAARRLHEDAAMLSEFDAEFPFGWHVTVATHPLVTLIAVLAAGAFVARRGAPASVVWITPVAALVVLAGSRALYRTLDGGAWLRGGGLVSLGGVVAGLAAAPLLARWARVSTSALLDALVPAALLALGVGRIGCFLGGCCYGGITTLPWGVVFPALGAPARHPLQLYSAAADFAIVWMVTRKPLPPGVSAARALAAFAMARFALETLRDPATCHPLGPSGLTLAQVLCVVLALAVRPWLDRGIVAPSHAR